MNITEIITVFKKGVCTSMETLKEKKLMYVKKKITDPTNKKGSLP